MGKVGIVVVLMLGLAGAQELPDKPEPPKSGSSSKGAFWGMVALSGAATVADVETMQGGIKRGCQERNPIYGPRPSRARAYGIAGGVTVGLGVVSYYAWKKVPKSRVWLAPLVAVTGWHMLGTGVNARCGR